MNNITYTLATRHDIDILIDGRLAFLREYAGEQTQESIDALKQYLCTYFDKAIQEQTYISCYAMNNGKVVGNGGLIIREYPGNFLNPTGMMGYLVNMYTVPEFRGQGICSNILKKLQEAAIKKGVKVFELHATKAGEPVYIRDGFKLHEEPTYRKYLNQ